MNEICSVCDWRMRRLVNECHCSLPLLFSRFRYYKEYKAYQGSWLWTGIEGADIVVACTSFMISGGMCGQGTIVKGMD